MYRFFVEPEQICDSRIVIEGSDVHHIKDVIRLKKGELIKVSTGEDTEYIAAIEEMETDRVSALITDVRKNFAELPTRITLYQCLPKGDKMEQVIKKAVELGAWRIVPVISERCVARPDPKKVQKKTERWNALSVSAAKQSGRMIEPKVSEPLSFSKMLEQAKEADLCIMPYENAEGMSYTREVVNKVKGSKETAVLIGPEGGFSETEVTLAKEAGFHIITLGRRILRTETAPIAVLSILMYTLED